MCFPLAPITTGPVAVVSGFTSLSDFPLPSFLLCALAAIISSRFRRSFDGSETPEPNSLLAVGDMFARSRTGEQVRRPALRRREWFHFLQRFCSAQFLAARLCGHVFSYAGRPVDSRPRRLVTSAGIARTPHTVNNVLGEIEVSPR